MNTYRFYYMTLDDEGKAVYKALYQGIIMHKTYVELPCSKEFATRETIGKIINYICLDNPFIFWLNRLASKICYSQKMIMFSYIMDRAQDIKLRGEISKEVRRIIRDTETAKETMSTLEKITTLHDYLCANYRYDWKMLDKDRYTVRGAFMNHLAVCEGYAKAMSMLLSALGIANVLVPGCVNEDKENPNHLWLAVRLHGKLFHIDITSDIGNTETNGRLSRFFFLKTDEEMRSTHFNFQLPETA